MEHATSVILEDEFVPCSLSEPHEKINEPPKSFQSHTLARLSGKKRDL